MKSMLEKFTFIACFFLWSVQAFSQPYGNKGVPMILDTDIGPDYDDVGALAMFHALADKGEVSPLAVVASNKHELVAPCIEVINTFYGRPQLPIGAPKGEGATKGATQGWPQMLVDKYPHTLQSTSQVPNAVSVYRRILAAQPDKSVTVVTIGFLTNLADLLASPADSLSGLSGLDLVRRKVKLLVSMAGKFPEGREYNVFVDSLASQRVFAEWPTSILFSGFEIGAEIKTGLEVVRNEGLKGPVKDVYALSLPLAPADKLGRMSWDQTAVLVAARGTNPYFGIKRGRMLVDGGHNSWADDPMGPHAYLIPQMPTPYLTQLIEALMMWEGR
ncbi:nucleoside hydrolase [Dyadobacter jejuensis]|nr:nucleoside hydrolase [Dyadobacter jejuensis]